MQTKIDGTVIIETFPNISAQFALAPNVELTYTVPGDSSNVFVIKFSWKQTLSVLVGYNMTIPLPVANVITDNKYVYRNPKSLFVKGGDILSFLSDTLVTDAGISLYSINNNPVQPTPTPPVQDFLLLDNTPFLLLDGTNFLLL